MRSEVVILLLLGCISCGMNACTHGDIRITGVNSETILAGRVDLCYESEWRVICQNNWDMNDARVVCREFGFPEENAQFCDNSCLGRNDSFKGINNFRCSGSEKKIIECEPAPNPLNGICGGTIGLTCYNSNSSIFDVFDPNSLLEPETTTTASSVASTKVLSQNTDMQDQQDSVDGNSTEATLGGLLGVLLIILVGVVIGWVWTCCKIKKMKFSSRTQVNTLSNIAYTTPPSSFSFPLHSAGQGPRKKSQNNTSITSPEKMHVAERDQRIYEVPVEGNYDVVKENSDAEEDVYHELENTREGKRSEITGEVSIQTKGEDISNVLSVYSTLQHN